jgi:hypothetical protein
MRLHRRGQMTWDPSGLGSGAVPVGGRHPHNGERRARYRETDHVSVLSRLRLKEYGATIL